MRWAQGALLPKTRKPERVHPFEIAVNKTACCAYYYNLNFCGARDTSTLTILQTFLYCSATYIDPPQGEVLPSNHDVFFDSNITAFGRAINSRWKLQLGPIFATCCSCNFSVYSPLALRRIIDINFPGDHESHRCVFSWHKSLSREARNGYNMRDAANTLASIREPIPKRQVIPER
jgi:hypothetical protein